MNRVSLLHILDHASGISEAEVRELEQLAAAFPYCQTAHLLLAKAAHDRGSMLAGQRLRRAATYAADRELLRALIELPPATADRSAAVVPEAAAPAVEALAEAPTEEQDSTELPAADSNAAFSAEADELPTAVEVAQPDTATEAPRPLDAVDGVPEAAADEAELQAAVPETPEAEEPPTPQPEPVTEPVASPEPAELAAPDEAPAAEAQPDPLTSTETDTQPILITEAPAESTDLEEEGTPVLVEAEAAELPAPEPAGEAEITTDAPEAGEATTPLPVSADTELVAVEAAAVAVPLPGADDAAPATDELPAAAPPIRPPVEAGSSRFEFGLSEATEPGPAYQLPELPEAPAAGSIPPYRADELLAYALSSGSRFGAALTLRDAELTQDLPTADAWHPDAATLAHYAAHRPAAPVVPSSLALIDKFLRSQPRIKSAQRPAPTDAPQADLSVRSTSAAPSLASESLAKIMVRQGKIGRAIEIYEQLMQRQPEKKAYFAAQIDLLNQQPE